VTGPASSNWGRWGDGDERGTLNYIGPTQVLRALSLVKEGRAYSLGHVIGSSKSPVVEGRRGAILHHLMRDGGDPSSAESDEDFVYAEDYIGFPVHSCTTHIDAIGHGGGADGLLYNGFPLASVTSRGVRHCGVESMGPIVTRAVLVDAPSLDGADSLADGFVVEADHLDRWLGATGTSLGSGDALFLRTGWPPHPARPNDVPLGHPGLGCSTVEWLHHHEVSLVGADTLAVECVPSESGAFSPLHVRLIRNLGLPLLELAALDELAADGVVEFCLVVAPLRIQGGTGSPVAPVALV